MRNEIVITTADIRRLERLVETGSTRDGRLEALEHELNRANVVAPARVSRNVVTMNSRVRIHDLDRDVETVCTIVYPIEADAERNRISVLAPLGTALLGCRAGKLVQFSAPGGVRRVKILAVEYQPEAGERERGVA